MELDRVSILERNVIEKYLDTVPVKLGAIADELGLTVKVGTMEHGRSGEIRPDPSARAGYTIKVNRHETKERQRFTLAHEIAHYLLHRDAIGDGIFDNVFYRSAGVSNKQEIEANRLAAEIIMPSKVLREQFGSDARNPTEEVVIELSKSFGVSVPAMEIRLGL